ncbi:MULTISPECIES: retron St85 family RNA-directed DNA polymerase [Aeromonas]|nr:retron St85 family RNA-directed DNA polymerase [Aeromonas veronii]MBL0467426.1 retron St85 family RNA-directed DNA polymerase [Aeromonas veronii]
MLLIEKIIKESKLSRPELTILSHKAPYMYKVYAIPKRRSGYRIIAHPAKPLKLIQRLILQLLEPSVKIHDNVHAYVKGRSIITNATVHKKNKYLLKMDINNFFNSIKPELFWSSLNKQDIMLPKIHQKTIERLIFWNPSKKKDGKLILSVGAPTSPFISNIVMFSFDSKLSSVCDKLGISYSRYADDLTFSTKKKNILFNLPHIVKILLQEEFSGAMTINEQKTVFSSKAHNRHVTGITITNDKQLSIGRARKKYIYHLIHQATLGNLDDERMNHLLGLISFCRSIDANFLDKIANKYGSSFVKDLIKRELK